MPLCVTSCTDTIHFYATKSSAATLVSIGMIIAFAVALALSLFPPPPCAMHRWTHCSSPTHFGAFSATPIQRRSSPAAALFLLDHAPGMRTSRSTPKSLVTACRIAFGRFVVPSTSVYP